MQDSATIPMVPCANDKLNIDTSDVLKIDVENLDELLRTVDERNLAALQRVRFIYNVNDDVVNDDVPDELELRTACFLGALPSCRHSSSMDGRERGSCCNEQSPRPA